jgi:hypothetical protein
MKKDLTGKNNNNWKGGKNKCLDCGKLLSDWKSKRCKKCWYILKSKIYPSKRIKNCLDCGVEIVGHYSKYCKKCFSKHRIMHPQSKEKHYKWKGGKPRCINCGKEIEYKATYCFSCCVRTKEKNSNWKNGISFLPYSPDWTETLKKAIRERDKYVCKLCNCWGKTVHHIDYDKKNCNPNNLINLCVGCNSKVNSNRERWTVFFNKLISKLKI